MNVNPFSYLIEKLKGKVDKSGDTMTGDLIIDKVDSTLSLRGSSSQFTNLKSSATYSDKTVTLPNKTGTVALTSDLPIFSEVDKTVAPSDDVYITDMPYGYFVMNIICYDIGYSLYYDYAQIAQEGVQVLYYVDKIRIINNSNRDYKVIFKYTK